MKRWNRKNNIINIQFNFEIEKTFRTWWLRYITCHVNYVKWTALPNTWGKYLNETICVDFSTTSDMEEDSDTSMEEVSSRFYSISDRLPASHHRIDGSTLLRQHQYHSSSHRRFSKIFPSRAGNKGWNWVYHSARIAWDLEPTKTNAHVPWSRFISCSPPS